MLLLAALGGLVAMFLLGRAKGEEPPPTTKSTWKMAVAVIEEPTVPVTQADLDNLEVFKSEMARHFASATGGKGTLDVSHQTFVFQEDSFYEWSGTLRHLYNDHDFPDLFDFVILVPTATSVQVAYTRTWQPFEGIGLPVWGHGIYNAQKLLGYTRGRILSYLSSDPATWAYVFVHEFFHAWLSYWSYLDEGILKDVLDPEECRCHLGRLVRTNGSDISQGGGFFSGKWRDNGDGTWMIDNENFTPLPEGHEYNLDLYLMGLIPKEAVHPIHILETTAEWPYVGTIQATEKLITIDQIIAAVGERNEA